MRSGSLRGAARSPEPAEGRRHGGLPRGWLTDWLTELNWTELSWAELSWLDCWMGGRTDGWMGWLGRPVHPAESRAADRGTSSCLGVCLFLVNGPVRRPATPPPHQFTWHLHSQRSHRRLRGDSYFIVLQQRECELRHGAALRCGGETRVPLRSENSADSSRTCRLQTSGQLVRTQELSTHWWVFVF